MTDQHPITPPPELVQQWIKQGVSRPPSTDYMTHFANCAAHWGADQELEACCQSLYNRFASPVHQAQFLAQELRDWLRAARRPKPSSLKEQALEQTEQHRAAPELWAAVEKWGANTMDTANCFLELRARIEALEAAQQKIRSGPESPLVERVADAIAAQATSAGIVNDRPARAAIREVAAWLREYDINGSAAALEKEAGPTINQEDYDA